MVDEDSPFSFALPAGTFTDEDIRRGDYLTYAATLEGGSALSTWLSFNAETGIFSGTPDNSFIGGYDIIVTATDSDGQSVSDTFALTVNNVNDAPVAIAAIPDQTPLYISYH